MGFEILLSVLLIASYQLQNGEGQIMSDLITIKDFLSDSNPTIDDQSKAFQDAWKALCEGRGRSLVIRANETYTIQPQLFQGPCISPNPHIQIDGRIEAPKWVRDWGAIKRECWLCFEKVSGLVLTGSGLLDVHGETWWSSVHVSSRPRGIIFSGCQHLIYDGLTQKNSPKNHISIIGCNNVTLSNLHIIAPEDSPNTDGVDISLSHDIHIFSSTFETGDDCIAINGGSSDINIAYVACGPGHGISVGSLGRRGETEMVENVNVKHCTFKGTQNGARIKTWPGGRGFARNITYENITLIDADFPIIIDQRYCNGGHRKPAPGATAVKVSDVKFKYFRGTCSNGAAINLECDTKIGCDNILLEHINITSSSPRKPLSAYCTFARIISRFVSIDINCRFHGEPICPAPPQPQPQPPAPYGESPAPQAPPPAPPVRPPLFSPFRYLL